MRAKLTLLAPLFLTGAATAQLDVAIVASAANSTTNCNFTDPQAKLMATGFFNTVDIIDVRSVTPTLAELLAYDACICWTNYSPWDYTAWGNVMADYVDAGGGVVVTVFANSTGTLGQYLGGRWATGGYEVIVSQSGTTAFGSCRGHVHDPIHPVMSGVSSFCGGSGSFRPTGTALTPGSSLIAEWGDGLVLVAEGASFQRIDLGMYPPSSDCDPYGWEAVGDGGLLMANALVYVAGAQIGPGIPYCPGDGSGYSCPCHNHGSSFGEGCANGTGLGGRLGGSGSDSIVQGDLVLEASQCPAGQPGLMFQGINPINRGYGSTFGDGMRCTGGGVVRLQVLSISASGEGATSVSISATGGVASGDTRYYQFWYRDPAGSPCGSLFNLTNGLAVTWSL